MDDWVNLWAQSGTLDNITWYYGIHSIAAIAGNLNAGVWSFRTLVKWTFEFRLRGFRFRNSLSAITSGPGMVDNRRGNIPTVRDVAKLCRLLAQMECEWHFTRESHQGLGSFHIHGYIHFINPQRRSGVLSTLGTETGKTPQYLAPTMDRATTWPRLLLWALLT